jgi:hypothetical protein
MLKVSNTIQQLKYDSFIINCNNKLNTFIKLKYDCFIRRFRKSSKNDCKLRHVRPSVLPFVCPSVRMEQLDSHWMNFHHFFTFEYFFNIREKTQVSLQSDKNCR